MVTVSHISAAEDAAILKTLPNWHLKGRCRYFTINAMVVLVQ